MLPILAATPEPNRILILVIFGAGLLLGAVVVLTALVVVSKRKVTAIPTPTPSPTESASWLPDDELVAVITAAAMATLRKRVVVRDIQPVEKPS
ncbi:MAG: hypothetical protein AAGL98_13920 [Planctomycetota bacterium]